MVVASITVWSGIAYLFENQIIRWLLKPAHGERFIYTTPGGGIDFIIRVCIYAGVIVSAPLIIYQILKFIQPLIGKDSTRFILLSSAWAGLLALGGVAFGYFFGLPVALHFLLNSFNISQITALVTIQSYLTFVIAYLAGAALIFQVPLWMFIINRIKPLPLRKLFKHQRWVILISFVVAAAINPSPRPQDLFLLALPILGSYEVGVGLVWYTNRRHKRPAYVVQLLEGDHQAQAARLAKLETLQHIIEPLEKPAAVIEKLVSPQPPQRPAPRPDQKIISDFVAARRRQY